MNTTRPAAVSGMFYPGNPMQLGAEIENLLARARQRIDPKRDLGDLPKVFIVPHAGYRYSGSVAASVYARLQADPDRFTRVVLFGPAHRVAVPGLGIPSVSAFATPLGTVELDRENLDLLKAQPYTTVSDETHAEEHSLEVQIPFLQTVLKDFRLTPVVVGDASPGMVADALEKLWGGPETLILISSDLSHYHDYNTAQGLDAASSMSIMTMAADKLRSQNACGWRGVNGVLRVARAHGLHPVTLDLRNSGDTSPARDRAVGYGAWAFSESMSAPQVPLEPGHKQKMLEVAGTGIRRLVSGNKSLAVAVSTFAEPLQVPGACFVTLTRDGRLRGCLGTLHAYRPLISDVLDRACATATSDPRFPAVQKQELPGMGLEISVLTSPQEMQFDNEADLLQQLRPGQDGLIIQDRGMRSTYLPKVWSQIPKPVDFVMQLKKKAGLAPDHWSESFRAWRYETDRFETTMTE